MKILIGADPEMFVQKDGAYVSAYGMIQGTKEKPNVVPLGAVQVDGMALEFNIDPVETEDMFVHSIQSVMSTLKGMVPDYEVVATPVAHFSHEYLAAQPEDAKRLGCEPDFNAWGGGGNPMPDDKRLFRTGAGHLHIGWTQGMDIHDVQHREGAYALVRQLDFYLGLPSLRFDTNWERRELYGKAGACRIKPYGVEYRVLSNAWLTSEKLMRWVYSSALLAVNNLRNGNVLADRCGDIQEIINESQVYNAAVIMDREGIPHAL